MKIHESGENYLETILIIGRTKGVVRSVDIVEELKLAKSSVSRAVNILKDEGYISIEKSGEIKFTEKGRIRAEEIYGRHAILTEYLKMIGVSQETAEADACRIEHIISKETLEAIKKHGKSLKKI
jgi:Mn-dependent DtxR family transcriptional regulator